MFNKNGWPVVVCVTAFSIGLILYFISMACFFSAKNRMESFKDNFSKMYDTWSSDLVFDITNDELKAVSGNEYLAPWQGYWPGTKQGCYCATSSYYYNRYTAGLKDRDCNYNETWGGCTRLAPRGAQPINKWISNQKLFAIKVKGTSFLQLYSKMNPDGSCQSGYKRCGNPSSTSKGICIPATLANCPISSVASANTGSDSELKFGPLSFWVSRDERKNPISDVNITESHLCTVRTDYPVSVNRPRYPLLLGYSANCQNDALADKIGIPLGEKDLFDQNGINYVGLLTYDVSNAYQYYMMAGRPLEWSPNCQKEIPGLLSSSQQGNDLFKQYETLVILFIVSAIVFCLAYCVLGCAMGATDPKSMKLLFVLGICLLFSAIFLIFPSFCIIKSRSASLTQDTSSVASKKCSNTMTNDYFAQLNNNYDNSVGYMNNWFFWLGMIAMILTATTVFLGCCAYFNTEDGPGHNDFTNRNNTYTQLGEVRTPAETQYGGGGYGTFAGNYGYPNTQPNVQPNAPGAWNPNQAGMGMGYPPNNINKGPGLIAHDTKPNRF